ncbi:MAG: autotransporter-associated beta strand repeat-containing protein [Nitrospirales bacterium]|nr:autotransporter-associated beta strand repeat-containing protein [Nitrospirales bacterium]
MRQGGNLTIQDGSFANSSVTAGAAGGVDSTAGQALGGVLFVDVVTPLWDISSGYTLILPEAIAGTGGLSKQGLGTLALGSSNPFTGATNIIAGTLQLFGSGALGNGNAVTLGASGTLDLNDVSTTIGSLTGSGAALLGTGTLTVGDATSTTFAGILSETGSLVKQGTGTLTLSGANTYSGATNITAGILQLNGSGTLGVGSAVTLGASGTLDLNDVSATIGSLTGSGAALLGTGTLTVGDATSTTFAGILSEAGSLVKQGTGTLTLSGANTYSGGTTVTSAGNDDLAARQHHQQRSGHV